MAAMLKTPNSSVGGGGLHCGNGLHHACGLMHGSWDAFPDFRYCNYAIYFGVNNGHATGHAAMVSARLVAEAMARGMKLVVFDPICNYSAAKATEWIPIIPGTDGVVILAMLNVIVNELGIFDGDYLKRKTNGPYLIGADGRYVRDRASKKPLIWDAVRNRAFPYDDEGIVDFALTGSFEVEGKEAKPAFELLMDHLRQYTPERAAGISSVPAETIRRIAREYAKAAQIGEEITIDGKKLPYRPVASTIFRGGEGHGNAFHTCMAVCLLNQVLGAADVPGGAVGAPNTCLGYPETGKLRFGVEKGPDGLLSLQRFYAYASPWPVKEPSFPKTAGLKELFPLCDFSPIWAMTEREEIWQKAGIPPIEIMFNFGSNSVMGMANPKTHGDFLRKIPFIVHWDIFANEFAEGFADLLLPDTSYFETFTWLDGQGFSHSYPYGLDPWCFHITQPVVKPAYARRYIMEVCLEIMDRLGKRREVNEYWNRFLGLEGEDRIKPEEKVTWEELGNRALKNYFGPAHDLAWFKREGFISWSKRVEEAYWRCFTDVRVPIYLEFMVDLKDRVREIASPLGINVKWEQYTPLVGWFPCAPHEVEDKSYDLYCFSYRDILHTASASMEQPWLDEASMMSPYTYYVSINTRTAQEKGLQDLDEVYVESVYGHRVKGRIKLREGQHPQTLAIACTAGHWAKGQPIARGKGTHFNALMEAKFAECDAVTLNLETCVRVKIYKAES